MTSKIKLLVKECLEVDERARNSDWKLYEDVCKKMGLDTKVLTLSDIAKNPEIYPTFESVSRYRRLWQEDGEYQACDKVKFERAMNEVKYRKEFA